MNYGTLYTHIEDTIATVEFFHPASNSLPSELLGRLTKSIHQLSENDEVHVIILKSEGDRAFCAGASFDELVAITNFTDGKQFFLGFANVINAMRTCKKPIIGRVQGKVVGGGVGLISACDYAYATDQAAIKLSELTIGIGPFVIAPVVKHKMGNTALRELTLNATKWHNAYWAKEKGLFADVFDNTKQLDESVDKLADKLASYNPEAVQKMKSVFWQGTDNWDKLLEEQAEISGKLVLSAFTKKALEKFKK